MTPHEFIAKWKPNALTERAAAQEHFLDLCRLFDHPTPAEDDPTGERFTFEKGVVKTGGGDGFADVWKKNFFAWEYKKKKRDLGAALEQLTRYAAALENPPLHVVCDTVRFRIETRWTSTVVAKREFELADLADPENLRWLRAAFHNPDELKPKETRASLTEAAAAKFQSISDALQQRNPDREAVAHFVNQLVFCFFANSVKLLPERMLNDLFERCIQRPSNTQAYFTQLFEQMKNGGELGFKDIKHFNGGLFDGRVGIHLDPHEVQTLIALLSFRWDLIDPTIFGTLFERFLDPDKRAQIGAHYTSVDTILLIVEPVILRPLRADWAIAKAKIEAVMRPVLDEKAGGGKLEKRFEAARAKAEALRDTFVDRLCAIRILDPACGSGNFLYVALQEVKNLELQALLECEALMLGRAVPRVGPRILQGIEINPLAAELARTVIWIGDIQWGIQNGLSQRPEPILEKLDTIECRDALIDWSGPEPKQADWFTSDGKVPDFIVGNPPFLGDRRMISSLGESYVETLRGLYADQIPGRSDLVCYWFAQGARLLESDPSLRLGFVATNSINGGNNLPTLKYVVDRAKIFEAFSDEAWVVEGASVRVALICFSGPDALDLTVLDRVGVARIAADLSAGTGMTRALTLSDNKGVSFIGTQKNGPFDISGNEARGLLKEPLNVNQRPNADVVRPWTNGAGIVRGEADMWVIDFGHERTEAQAALYEAPFEIVSRLVKPTRENLRREWHRTKWWLHGDPRPALRRALTNIERFAATPLVAKHRIFVWLPPIKIPENTVVALARDDDTTFGILHSRFHEAWSLRLGTSLEDRPRYTPTTTFETYPFPEGMTPNIPAMDYAADPRAMRISAAAKRLDELRRNWLNPPDLGRWEPEITPTAAPGQTPLKYPDRFVAKDTEAALKLKKRTLTKLYNQRPQWLSDAHATLDCAVAAAYGWPEDIATDEALAKLLALNLERAAAGR